MTVICDSVPIKDNHIKHNWVILEKMFCEMLEVKYGLKNIGRENIK